jgi:hypothetical protein
MIEVLPLNELDEAGLRRMIKGYKIVHYRLGK